MGHIPRLYLPRRLAPGLLVLDAEQSRRLAAVMRLRPGHEVRLFSGDGREWAATAAAASRRAVTLAVEGVARQEAPLPLALELWCPVVRPARFEWALEKAVEAGADVIQPIVCDHSARGDASPAKNDRWERLLVEAAEQSGRLWLPVLAPSANFSDLVGRLRTPLVVAHREWTPLSQLSPLLPAQGRLAVAVGPEGGFSPAEIASARAAGALFLKLGPHILRTETAAVAAAALVRALSPA